MSDHRTDRSPIVKDDLRHVGTTISRLLALTLPIILAVTFTGRVQAAKPPAAAGNATETHAATNADGAGALSTRANECKERMLAICANQQYRFTPKVREAYLAYARAQAKTELESQGKSLPDDFLAWVDADPTVEATVYGMHHKPSEILLALYSLRLDLGRAGFEKYHQLALAAAMVQIEEEREADITPREPTELVIGGDPRIPVDTKEPGRELDQNNHIINKTVKDRMFKNVAELPVSQDAEAARKVFAFLQDEQCEVPAATVAYRVALEVCLSRHRAL